MNTDFRIHVDFFSHFKTIKLERQLGAEGVLSLIRLWAWVAKNRPDGILTGMSEEDIEIAARWNGEQRAFNGVITTLNFVNLVDGVYQIHDWKDHNEWQAQASQRSDASRLTRMAKTHPDIYKMLDSAGIKGISREVYDVITASNDRLTTVERMLTNRLSLFSSSPFLSFLNSSLQEEEKDSSLRSESPCHGSKEPDEQSVITPELVRDDQISTQKAKKKPEPLSEDSEAYRLASFMLTTLKANVPTLREPDLQAWARNFDVALRNDERMKDARFVAQVIKWACSDSFWRANIQSPNKLREKFDQLTTKMEAEAARTRTAQQQPSWKTQGQRRLQGNMAAMQEFINDSTIGRSPQ